jgi:sulfatase-modifying factor enzyme 1
MARLTLLLLPALLAAQTDFQQAGVCSRCHVVSVLEWGISKHRRAGTDCRRCHGASAAHVANERNELPPDRLPREGAIAGLCLSCHAPGCPKTKRTAACQTCHHPHALVDPNQTGQAGGPSHQPAPKPATVVARNAVQPGFTATGRDREVLVTGLDIPMVLVPAGEFDMGSDLVHTVRVPAFYLGKFEVTQAQWRAVMGTNPSAVLGDDLPVERVSWVDAQALVSKLNERVPGGGFRLPTEAEWEYACQGCAPGWSRDNSSFRPQPVGGKPANRWGIHDLLGNVWEWCSSLARDYPYDPADGRESRTAPGLRVLRGGSFADSSPYLDPLLRHSERPDRRLRWNGLRLAREAH